MTVHTLAIHQPVEQHNEIIQSNDLATSICEALKTYPHYIVVEGSPDIVESTELANLAKAIRKVLSGQALLPLQEKISVTKVQINPQQASRKDRVTRYSRTHLPLAPHTDSSYMVQPHELVAFQCAIADGEGGETIMAPVEDILRYLDPEVVTLLRDPVYPFGQGTYPILWGEADSPRIRYYRSQIDQILAHGLSPLLEKYQSAIATLDGLLNQTDLFDQFRLKPGQIALMHNHKVLHGRSGFSADSDRLLYRVRLHLEGLSSTGSQIPSPHPQASQGLQTQSQQLDYYLTSGWKCERSRHFNQALQQFQQALKVAPNHPVALDAYGSLLLRIGQFHQAIQIFRQCVAIDPNGYDSRLALSSLAHHLGNQAEAHQALVEVTQRHPYITEGKYRPQKPTLLRMRGFEGSAYQILEQHDGTYHKLLRGGHFSIRDLVNKAHYNLVILNIFENNIDRVGHFPDFNLILNTIACPDSKRESLLTAARLVDRYPHLPVINHPRKVLETTRERNSVRLNLIPGVQFPKTERLWWDGNSIDSVVKDILGLGFVFPLIVRQVGTQTGQTVALLQNEMALRAHFDQTPKDQEYYVIQYKDCRNPQGIFNKTRVFFIDGNFYPVANLFNNAWNTHSGDRYNVMNQCQWMQAAEKSFLGNPYGYFGSANFEKLYQIRDLIGLDFFGIDLTILPDGTLFIFELNAAMRHNFDHAKNFPYTEPHLKRISQAFDTMVKRRL